MPTGAELLQAGAELLLLLPRNSSQEAAAQAGSGFRRHSEPTLSTMHLFFSVLLEVQRWQSPGGSPAQLSSAPLQLQLCRGLGTGEPSPCLPLHR